MLSTRVVLDRRQLAAASGPIVKNSEYSRLVEAQRVVSEARLYAQALEAQMREEAERARQAGYEAGMKAAREEHAASVVETVAQLEGAFSALEPRIVNLVMSAIQQILKEMDERVVMERLIRRVLSQARSHKQLRLRVAASQFDQVNEWLAGLLKDFPQVELLDVLKDPAAKPGTCVLESEFGAIDASLEVQLAAVRRGLVNAFIDKRVAAAAGRD